MITPFVKPGIDYIDPIITWIKAVEVLQSPEGAGSQHHTSIVCKEEFSHVGETVGNCHRPLPAYIVILTPHYLKGGKIPSHDEYRFVGVAVVVYVMDGITDV